MITKINKKQWMTALFTIHCTLSISMMLASCAKDDDKASSLGSTVTPTEITLNLSDALSSDIYLDGANAQVLPLLKGQAVQLDYTLEPADVTHKDVIWTSSNPAVATISNDGILTAVSEAAPGYTMIEVKPYGYYSGGGIIASLKVTVSDAVVPATAIAVTAPSTELYAGETMQLTATVTPDAATYHTYDWVSSDESIATVDKNGVVTALNSSKAKATVTITAKAKEKDGSGVSGEVELTIRQIVEPTDVTIDQTYSVDNGYYCSIYDAPLALPFTTVPAECTTSMLTWTSSDENIATVDNGVVTFNRSAVFGDVIITATTPNTGKSSSIKLHVAAGLIHELFMDENYLLWRNNSSQSAGMVWHEGYLEIICKSGWRGDLVSNKVTLHAGNFPIVAFRIDDVIDRDDVTSRNITFDGSGGQAGDAKFSGGLNGNNNKWLHDYKCSDGSHVLIYDLASQKWATGGLLPTDQPTTFNALNLKYADIKGPSQQVSYKVYWMQTFKTLDDVETYLTKEGLTWNVVK